MNKSPIITIDGRKIGEKYSPLVIAEIGINHNGDFKKAKKMIDDAYRSGAECVKFQCHIVDDEMIPNDIVPANANESIWAMMKRCSLAEKEEFELKAYTEKLNMIYLNTPFSRAAADRLEKMDVPAYKIGSGECNNVPLIEHIASFRKPIILSTGMNNIKDISKSVKILEKYKVDHALLHVTSMYPTPYEKVRLGSLIELKQNFPKAVIGLSDHSFGNYTCFAAIALGASILEKHFTSNKRWKGSDIPISIDPLELADLINGTKAIHKALGGKKIILAEEKSTINFAYASVVATNDINKGDKFSEENIWVKRPGTGKIRANNYKTILNKTAKINIKKNTQLKWNMIEK